MPEANLSNQSLKCNIFILQYAGDQDDKQWLYEKMHMPATGGRTYLLMVEDILYLSRTDEYRYNLNLLIYAY